MAENVEGPDKECLKNLPLYLRDSGERLIETAFKLNWGDLSDDCVMDVGCGFDSLRLFRTLFPKFKKVIAMDISFSFINHLRFHEAYGGMEYHVADITNRSTLTEWKEQIPKIVSIYCFNCLRDQKAAFENIHYLLKPGGEAFIITAIKNPHYECAKYMFTKNKWKPLEYLLTEFPEYGKVGDEGLSYIERILQEFDFEIISIKEIFKYISFPTEKDFKDSKYTQDRVIAKRLDPADQNVFQEEYLDSLMTLNGRAPNGEFCIKTSSANIIIRKKKA